MKVRVNKGGALYLSGFCLPPEPKFILTQTIISDIFSRPAIVCRATITLLSLLETSI